MDTHNGGAGAPGDVFSSDTTGNQNTNTDTFNNEKTDQISDTSVTKNVDSVYPNPTKVFSGGVMDTVADKQDSIEVSSEPTRPNQSFNSASSNQPLPVVKVLSVRGVEYWMMSVALWFSAGAVIWILLALIYGKAGFENLAFPASLLAVAMPIFGLLFLRLRKQELLNPQLRQDPSKRRMSQITQFLAFLVCVVNLISFVYMMLMKAGGEGPDSVTQPLLGMLAILAVAGGLLVYYWIDEHKDLEV